MMESSHREFVDNITCPFLVQTKYQTRELSIRHSQFLKEHKVKSFESNCVSETVYVCLPEAALARLPPCWLYCVQTDARPQQSQLTALICFDRGGFSTALNTHMQQEPQRQRSERRWPLPLEEQTHAVVSVDCFFTHNLFFQKPNWQHSLVWIHLF